MQAGLRAGQSLVGFRLLRAIGQGASGTVYLAEHEGTRQVVAMKLVPLLSDAVRVATGAQFMAAAENASRLKHPGIVEVLAFGVEGELAWMTMEPVPGTDLVRYTREPRLLPEALVLQLTARLAEALAYAHRLGVVHRDIKPANVLVNWAADAVKLTDFGLARAADATNTGTGVVMGTPAYMPPEQLAGAVPSAASDIYALGIVLFELLCGRRPHEALSMGELLRQVANDPAPGLLALRPTLPPELAQLLARMLAKSPAARPTDGTALAAELRHLATALTGAGAKSH